MSHPNVTNPVVDECSLRAPSCRRRVCCWSDLEEVDVEEEEAAEEKWGKVAIPDATAEVDSADEDTEEVKAIVVRLTRVPR